MRPRAFEEVTSDDWHHLMAANADSTFLGAQATLSYLKRSRDSIADIAATKGLGDDWMFSAFNAAKGAVVNFIRGLTFDLGGHAIRFNAVPPPSPSPTSSLPPHPSTNGSARPRRVKPSRTRTPDDIAADVGLLASADARRITGVILPVDGGVSAVGGQAEFVGRVTHARHHRLGVTAGVSQEGAAAAGGAAVKPWRARRS